MLLNLPPSHYLPCDLTAETKDAIALLGAWVLMATSPMSAPMPPMSTWVLAAVGVYAVPPLSTVCTPKVLERPLDGVPG